MSHTLKKAMALSVAAAALGVAAAYAADAPKFYQLQNEMTFKSTDSTTDHVDYDPASKKLYMSRRKDGVTVVDVTTQKIVAQIAQSEGSNAVALAPKLDRGFTGNGDGTVTVFKLSDNSTIERVKFVSNTDGGIYDEASNTLAFQQADDSIIALMDPVTLKQTGEIKIEGEEVERPALDGKGNIYVPLRDKDLVFKIDLKAKKIVAKWDISADCQQPSGADFDPATNRLFLGCRGKMVAPMLVVLDGDTGKTVAKQPIGRGCDEVQFDAKSKQIFTANGVDGNVVVYKQADADHYDLQEAFSTRPGARVLRYDADTQRIFVMSNAGTVDPAAKRPLVRFNQWYINKVFANSLALLTYGYGAPAAK